MNLLEEVQDSALVLLVIYQRRIARHHNWGMKQRRFGVEDLVLWEAEASTLQNTGKLMPNLEGPYEVIEVPKLGRYRLRAMDEIEVKIT